MSGGVIVMHQNRLMQPISRCQGNRPEVCHDVRRHRLPEFVDLPPHGCERRFHRNRQKADTTWTRTQPGGS